MRQHDLLAQRRLGRVADEEGTIVSSRADEGHPEGIVDLSLIPGCSRHGVDDGVEAPAIAWHTSGDGDVVAVMVLASTDDDDVGVLSAFARTVDGRQMGQPRMGGHRLGDGIMPPVCSDINGRHAASREEDRKPVRASGAGGQPGIQ